MNDPTMLYEISGARSTETAQLALKRHDVPSNEAVYKAKLGQLKSMCKELGLLRTGTKPVLRQRILEFKKASDVPALLPVPQEPPELQEPPEGSSPAPPSIPAIPTMSPPTSDDGSDDSDDSDNDAALNNGPKTRKLKSRKRKDRAYKKMKELKRVRQSLTVSCCSFCYI